MSVDPTKKQYAYKNEESNDPDDHYFEYYDSLEDAVSSSGEEIVEIFEVSYKSLGRYKEKKGVTKVRGMK